MSFQVYSVPGQTERRRKAFLECKGIDLSYELSLKCGGNINYYKSVHHHILTRENREHPDNFQNKSVNPAFNWVSRYIFTFWPNGREEGGLFWRVQEGGHIVRLPLRALGCHVRWKSLSIYEIWNTPTPPLFFTRPPYKLAL